MSIQHEFGVSLESHTPHLLNLCLPLLQMVEDLARTALRDTRVLEDTGAIGGWSGPSNEPGAGFVLDEEGHMLAMDLHELDVCVVEV